MKREELKERWLNIVECVFAAEKAINSDGNKLNMVKEGKMTPEEYLNSIVEEVLSRTSDEEIEEMK